MSSSGMIEDNGYQPPRSPLLDDVSGVLLKEVGKGWSGYGGESILPGCFAVEANLYRLMYIKGVGVMCIEAPDHWDK